MLSTFTHLAPAASIPVPPRARLADLDRAKGVAILLVVFGHIVARRSPADIGWYDPLRIAIYLFHMPFFMYLSGYVAFVCGTARVPRARYRGFVRRRAARLLVPFLLFGLLILAAKLVVARYALVDNVPPDFWTGLRDLFWNTEHSPATSVWYILVLFIYGVVTPPLLAADPSRVLLLAVAALAYVAPLPPVLYLDRVGTYFIFFVAGGLAADAGPRWHRLMQATRWPALAGLLAMAGAVAGGLIRFDWSEGAQGFPYKWALLVAGLLSMPAIHGLLRRSPPTQGLELLGRNVFVIYLLNTLCIGAAKAVLFQFTTWDGERFLPIAAALMLAGTLGPLAAKRWVLRHVPLLDRMTN